jgi:hypothetical protein
MKTLAQKHARAQWFADRDPRTGCTGRYHGLSIRIERYGSCVDDWNVSVLNADGSRVTGCCTHGKVYALKRLAKSLIDEGLAKGWIACACQQKSKGNVTS